MASGIPAYDGPSQAVGEFAGQVFLRVLALSGVPSGPAGVVDLAPYLVPIHPSCIAWVQSGGVAGLGALDVLHGLVSFDLSTLTAPATVAAVAIVGDQAQGQLVAVVALDTPVGVVPGPNVLTVSLSLQAFDDLAGD